MKIFCALFLVLLWWSPPGCGGSGDADADADADGVADADGDPDADDHADSGDDADIDDDADHEPVTPDCLFTFADLTRPHWEFAGDEEEHRSYLRDWIDLPQDERLVSFRAYLAAGGREDAQARATRALSLSRLTGEPEHAQLARDLIDVLLEDVVDRPSLEDEIKGDGCNLHGSATPELSAAATANRRARDGAFEYAMRYLLDGVDDDASRARALLVRFADIIPTWPLYDGDSGARTEQSDTDHHGRWNGRGLWGEWYHLDFRGSWPLLRAYDILYDIMPEAERDHVARDIFRHQVALIDNWELSYGNMLPYRLRGLIRFAEVVMEPAWVHQVHRDFADLIHIGFFPDGFWREGTPSYHQQVQARTQDLMPPILQGYCDPEGYVDAVDGTHLDYYDLEWEFGHQVMRSFDAIAKLVLPARQWAVVHDTALDATAWAHDTPERSEPALLGCSGHAILGSGEAVAEQQQVHLHFGGTHGHEHYDALNLFWWGHGREVLSETRYREIPGSDSTRAWHAATAGHNTVVIDEHNQSGRFGGNEIEITEDDELRGIVLWRYRDMGQGNTRNQGTPMVFDGNWPEVQAAEASAENAYSEPRPDLYRRTIVKVELDAGDGYVVDIFRVRGGSTHDYMLHGCLDEAYTLAVGPATTPASGTLHEHITLTERAGATAPFTAAFTNPDGVQILSRFLAPAAVELLVGEAPAMRIDADATFLNVRNTGGESTFVVVHELAGGASQITDAELLHGPDEGSVVLRVVLAGREDLIFSAEAETTVTLADGTHFAGRLAYLRRVAGVATAARIFDGTELSDPTGLTIGGVAPLAGDVLGTRSTERGDGADALVVAGNLPAGGDLVGRTIFVALGSAITYAYRITAVLETSVERSVLAIEHEPGFGIDGDGMIDMTYFPGWGIREACTFRIPGAATATM